MIKTLIFSSMFIVPAFVQVSTDESGHIKFTKHHVKIVKQVKMVNNHPTSSYIVKQISNKPTQKDINRYIHNAAVKYKVDEKLINAIIKTESSFRTNAVSEKGAMGLMQLMPATAERFGVMDRTNVKQNIEGGVRFLRFLLDTFNNNTKLAVAGYNAGEHSVMRHNNSIPPYPETMVYVERVMTEYKRT